MNGQWIGAVCPNLGVGGMGKVGTVEPAEIRVYYVLNLTIKQLILFCAQVPLLGQWILVDIGTFKLSTLKLGLLAVICGEVWKWQDSQLELAEEKKVVFVAERV